ncbi:MAG: hypothetical protein ABGZ35_14545, partial [Planctomycetaceae bacterium]
MSSSRIDTPMQMLLEAAVLAPSGDNTQPWRFDVDETDRQIVVNVDPVRDTSPMNAGQRMSRIAIGAAVENIVRTVAFNDLKVATEPSATSHSVSIRLHEVAKTPLRADEAVANRCTNRRACHGKTVSAETLQRLQQQSTDLSEVETHWITDAEHVRRMAAVVRQADAILFGTAELRHAFLENVRFDRPDDETVDEGLSLASLEIKGRDRAPFRLLPKLPNWLVRLMRVGSTIGRQNEQLILGGAGLCLGVAADDEPLTDIAVGRAMQRAWLALTEQNLAVQPMMSLLVLQNALTHGSDSVRSALGTDRVQNLLEQLSTVCPQIDDGRPAFLLRFGYA